MKKIIIPLIFIFVFSISLISSEEFGYNYLEKGINLNPAINYSTVNVNNSQYLQSHSASYFYQASNPLNFINTSVTDGSINSSSWKRSGTNVQLQNINDNVNITGTLNVSNNVGITNNLFVVGKIAGGSILAGFSGVYDFVLSSSTGGIILDRTGGEESFLRMTTDNAGGGQIRGITGGGLRFTDNTGTTEYVKITSTGISFGGSTPITPIDVYASRGNPASSGTTRNSMLSLEALDSYAGILMGITTGTNPLGWIQVQDRNDLSSTRGLLLNPIKGSVVIGATTNVTSDKFQVNGSTRLLNDNDKLYLGGSGDSSITYDGTNTVIKNEVGSGDVIFDLNGGNVKGNITANVYHGNIDWVYTIIGMAGNTACDNLDNKIAGYSYTCQTCIDTSGATQSCSTTLVTLNANCGCKID